MINEKWLYRTSCRSFTNEKIDEKTINDLKTIINLSPTSMNCQAFSAIFITDKDKLQAIFENNFKNKFILSAPLVILFCADYNRINESLKIHNNTTIDINNWSQFTVSTVDVALAAAHVNYYATEMGLGTCYIGGVRLNADKLKQIFNCKGKCMPMLGLVIGHPNKQVPLRPKINKCYDNIYNLDMVKDELYKYDIVMSKYYKNVFDLDTNFTKIVSEQVGKVIDKNFIDLVNKCFFNKK